MKNKTTAAVLAIFLGGIGVHRFYLGETLKGVIMLLFCWTVIPSILALISGIIWLLGSNESFDSKYNSQAIQKQQVEVQKEMLDELKKKNN